MPNSTTAYISSQPILILIQRLPRRALQLPLPNPKDFRRVIADGLRLGTSAVHLTRPFNFTSITVSFPSSNFCPAVSLQFSSFCDTKLIDSDLFCSPIPYRTIAGNTGGVLFSLSGWIIGRVVVVWQAWHEKAFDDLAKTGQQIVYRLIQFAQL